MSIKALAIELYKAQQEVHRLQDRLETASLGDKDQVCNELKRAEAACNYLRRIMDGEKEPSPFSGDSFKR